MPPIQSNAISFTAESHAIASISNPVEFKNSEGEVLFTAMPGPDLMSSPSADRPIAPTINHNETVVLS